ncbi:MAG: hypothetical protein Tsb0013_18570 [Phycisphaerales bacterium]
MRWCVPLILTVLIVGVVSAQRSDAPGGALSWSDDRESALAARLEALDPDDPMGYFELGEELVSSFPGADGYRLARELYALAYALDEQRGGSLRLAPSAALAIAEVTPDARERRWLLTMARSLRRVGDAPGGERGVSRERLACAELLALHRAGDYKRVRPMLRRYDVLELLVGAGMQRREAASLVARIERDIETIDEDRYDPSTRNEERLEPHPRNGGNPGPSLDETAFVRSLRGELLLVGAEPSSWGADLAVREGTPARDLDPDELLSITGVDPARPLWVRGPNGWIDGRWTAR